MHFSKLGSMKTGQTRLAAFACALVIFLASAAFGGVLDDQWLADASDPSIFAESRSEIILYNMKGGYTDFSPLAMRLVAASKEQLNPSAALTLAELAVAAAPNDARAHAQVVAAAFSGLHSPGKAVLGLWSYMRAGLTDPWVQVGLSLRLWVVISVAGLLVAAAIIVSGLIYFFPLFIHDVRDKFSTNIRTFTPAAVLVLCLFMLAWLGGGLILFILLPAAGMIAYMPLRARLALVTGLVLALGIFPALDGVSKMSGESGERAWALYRVLHGDSGAELAQELKERFASDDYKGLHARALVARRDGNFADAEKLLGKSLDNGGDAGLIHFELGSLKLLQGELDAAVEQLAEASRYRPEDWMLWYNLNGIHLARLDLASAARTLNVARRIDPDAVERHQALTGEAAAGGTQAFSRQFPSSWVTAELCRGFAAPYSEWVESLWAVLGVSARVVRPGYVMIFMALILLVAQSVQKKNLTSRCDSCGSLKCFSCHTVAPNSDVCGGCLALTKRDNVDETFRQRLRFQITRWSVKTSKAARWGEILFPGWSNYLYKGGFAALLLGCVWALSLGLVVANLAVYFQYLPWLVSGFSVVALPVWACTHLIGVFASRRR
jgi:tetratricopeptide (TPR) repeat protein